MAKRDNEAQPVLEDETEPEEENKAKRICKLVCLIVFHIVFIAYFIWCTVVYIRYDRKEHCHFNTTKDDSNSTQEVEYTPPILCLFNWCMGYGFLVVLFVLFYIAYFYYKVFKPYVGQKVYDNSIEPAIDKWMEFSRTRIMSIVMILFVIVVMGAIILFESRHELLKVRGVAAPIFFIFVGFVFSKHRRAIPWRIVVHGLFLQFMLGIVVIRWDRGREVFACAGDKAAIFFSYAREGALFVYGETIVNDFVFAFAILAGIFFFSVITSCLFYLGVIQFFLGVFGWLLQAMIGTTVCESVNAAANIFLSMSESPLLIRPYISRLTRSELHTICVSGYATVAGTVLGAYISFGASAAHLITASVMGAPGSLAFGKLFYPETEESQTKADNIELEASEDETLLDAAASGAANAMMIVLGIVSNIIAFISMIAFFNAVVEWSFELAGVDEVTFIGLLSKAFMPLVFLMGVPWYDCQKIGLVVAEKTLINEFVGYMDLGKMIMGGEIDARSAAIATFALCGFANPGSLGILIAALSVMAPTRRAEITEVAFLAFFAGSIVSFTSASWAGIFVQETEVNSISEKLIDLYLKNSK